MGFLKGIKGERVDAECTVSSMVFPINCGEIHKKPTVLN